MTQYTPSFDPEQFELRNYTNPYLTPEQSEKVSDTETRVKGELDFVAQMLGWSGPSYWSSLANTVAEKRQLLAGTYGVYNSFVIPKIYEIRNWNDTIVIDRLQFVEANRQTYVERIIVGEDVYKLQSVRVEDDKYVISVGTLTQSFYDQIAAGVQIKIDIPTYRSAPFERSDIGVSGDNSFICATDGSQLVLYPGWDTTKLFPYLFPVLFSGSVYLFNQPVYLTFPSSAVPNILPSYDPQVQLWTLSIPTELGGQSSGLEGNLVWQYSNETTQTDTSLLVKIEPWVDPSDWKSINVLDNFRGTWNNKGGVLPFNFIFDSLSIHGFDEQNSLYLNNIERTLSFNDLVSRVYSQNTIQSASAPGDPKKGDLWWNTSTGSLSVWSPNETNCGFWIEIDYRKEPTKIDSTFVFPDVSSFISGSGSISVGTTVTILDITGLSATENVIGIQNTLTSPGAMTLYQEDSGIYWIPSSISFSNVADFSADANSLPFEVPVTIFNSDGLAPSNGIFTVSNLKIPVIGEYEAVVIKYYQNDNWEISTNSILKYIANSSLFTTGSQLSGEMWWDFTNPDLNTRASSIYYQNAWVATNFHPSSTTPAPILDLSTVLFYSDGFLLTDGVPYATDNYVLTYTGNPVNGEYDIIYSPRNYTGKVTLPVITISDSLTTTYQTDISESVFGGLTYKMSPNIYDAETPLRLWKSQDLQVVETVTHLVEENYINPLRADLNNGPGAENWERYFIRLPLDYGRNETQWQRTVLTSQNFGYWGSPSEPEAMLCPPGESKPAIYEELFLYNEPVPDYTYVYCEPYLYSNVAYSYAPEIGDFRNSSIFPSTDEQFDDFSEAVLVDYDPLHNRQANTTSTVTKGYGDWIGEYVNINPCTQLTGFYTTDLLNEGIEPVAAPVWDASIYKFAPTCLNDPESYSVDSNHFKIGYAYFVADASAAEEGFFDPQQEAAWRFPITQPKTLYLTPR